jgi:hypothetical protein
MFGVDGAALLAAGVVRRRVRCLRHLNSAREQALGAEPLRRVAEQLLTAFRTPTRDAHSCLG